MLCCLNSLSLINFGHVVVAPTKYWSCRRCAKNIYNAAVSPTARGLESCSRGRRHYQNCFCVDNGFINYWLCKVLYITNISTEIDVLNNFEINDGTIISA